MPGLMVDAIHKISVWMKATPVPGYDPNKFRKDRYGSFIAFDDYGTTGKYGWEIDHIFPASLGGSDQIENLQPLHWKNNRIKSDRLLG